MRRATVAVPWGVLLGGGEQSCSRWKDEHLFLYNFVMKRCTRCGLVKSAEAFPINRSRKDGRHGWCLVCQRAYVRGHYERNRDYYLAKARVRNDLMLRSTRGLIRRLKDVPCSDCRARYPSWVMEFDHVRGNKLFNVSTNLRSRGRAQLLAEISKCEVVCANCHRDRTFHRMVDRLGAGGMGAVMADRKGTEWWRARNDLNARPSDP